MPDCFFKDLPDAGPCEGRPVRCHMITQQEITNRVRSMMRAEGIRPNDRECVVAVVAACADMRSWVWGCGGVGHGNAGHHGRFKPDGPLPVPRSRLPEALEEFAEELGLGWWLERTYGVRPGSFFRGDVEDTFTSTVDGAAGVEEFNRRPGPFHQLREPEVPDWKDAS